MSRTAVQVLKTIAARRKSLPTDSDSLFHLMDLAEQLKYRADLCLQHPWRATYTAAFLLMRIRECFQSMSLLFSIGLLEDALTVNRKCFELTSTLIYLLGSGKWQPWWDGDRLNVKDMMSRMPPGFFEPGYELYQTLSPFAHASNSLANSTAAEFTVVIDPSAVGLAVRSEEWPITLLGLYTPLIEQMGFTLIDLHYPRESEDYRQAHLARHLFHFAFRHPKLFKRLVEGGEDNLESNTREFLPLIIREGILNEDRTPGRLFIDGVNEEFTLVLSNLSPESSDSAKQMVQEVLEETPVI